MAVEWDIAKVDLRVVQSAAGSVVWSEIAEADATVEMTVVGLVNSKD